MIDDEPALPIELQTLTGIGKAILIKRRNLFRLGLVHTDDQANAAGTGLTAQMEQLQRRAAMELRNIR